MLPYVIDRHLPVVVAVVTDGIVVVDALTGCRSDDGTIIGVVGSRYRNQCIWLMIFETMST